MRRRALVFAVAFTTAAACAGPARRAPTPTIPAPAASVSASNTDQALDEATAIIDRTVDYWQYLQTLPSDALADEYERVMAAHLADRRDAETRIELAFLLTMPNTRWRNLDTAVSLINQYIDNTTDDDPLLNWFLLVNDDIQQQRYLERQLKTLQQRQQQLERQLEELKSIERSLQQRTTPPEETR